VTHNTKQGLIVIGITLVIVCLIGFGVAIYQQRLERKAAISSVEQSLKRSYQEIVTNRFRAETSLSAFTTEELKTAFLDCEPARLKFTSYFPPENIWLAKGSVKLDSTNLFCVALDFDGLRWGIDGKGEYRRVSNQEFTNWPCVSAKEAHP